MLVLHTYVIMVVAYKSHHDDDDDDDIDDSYTKVIQRETSRRYLRYPLRELMRRVR